MTEKRIEHLLAYFKGSLSVMDKMQEMHPEKFKDGVNSKIVRSIFGDTINILTYLKSLPEQLEKIEQKTEDFESIFDEISNTAKTVITDSKNPEDNHIE